jgi:predicted acetyltransferase
VTVEIRPARADELVDFRRVSAYVFASNDFNPEDLSDEPMQPEWTLGAFVDGKLATTMGAYPFTMRWNGAAIPVAGITAVGSYPEYRRRGLLRSVMEQGFRDQRERGQYVAILWASMGAIYQRFGYGLASIYVRYDFAPRDAAFQQPVEPTGHVRLATKDEARADMERVYKEYSAPRNLLLHRAPPMWDRMVREQKGKRAHIGVYRDGDDRPTGYLVYETVEDGRPFQPAPDQTLEVRDFVAVDLDAYRGIWEFIRRHDLVARVDVKVAEDDPAPALLLEPRVLRRRTSDGIWMRVVDVEHALPRRPYGDAGALTLRVRDDVCDWNDATFRLETDGPDAQVSRTTHHEPDVTLPARSLAMLSSGYASATQLARWGLLEARDAAALRTADRLFATEYRPYCPDGF